MTQAVLLSGARTPVGKFLGCFRQVAAADLGAVAIAGALERAGLDPREVDHVIIGQVLQAGQGQLPARQAAISAGVPMSVPVSTVNQLCLSGLFAIHLASLMIRSGEAKIVVAGGMESMTQAPYLLLDGREGSKFGHQPLLDSLVHDGLECAFDHLAMGAATEQYVGESIPRSEQDAFAAESHQRAYAAQQTGRFAEEIVPVTVPSERGAESLVIEDEGIRPGTTPEVLAKLKPAFGPSGVITAGNSSQLSDGASAVVVASADVARSMSVEPLAEIIGFGEVAGPNPSLLHQPANAIRKALTRSDLELSNIDFVEINEAFAAVALASIADLKLDEKRVNVNGGAIALGHPIGMSGNRLALTLAYELRNNSGGYGVAALCGGGGQGAALVLRRAT